MLVRFLFLGLFVSAGSLLHSAETDVRELHRQLAAAQEQTDKPAIIELSRRIVEADPQDAETWETLARTQFEAGENDRCTATLDAWENSMRPHPAVIDDLRGDVAEARKDHKAAERYWRLSIAARPEEVDGFEKLADLCAGEKRWRDAVEFRTRALALDEPRLAGSGARISIWSCTSGTRHWLTRTERTHSILPMLR